MARYRMNDGTIVDAAKASQTWEEATDWNGSNQISRNTRDQWEHETLYRSAKGRYWKEFVSGRRQGQGEAYFLEPPETAAWLIANDHELPDDLKQHEDNILE